MPFSCHKSRGFRGSCSNVRHRQIQPAFGGSYWPGAQLRGSLQIHRCTVATLSLWAWFSLCDAHLSVTSQLKCTAQCACLCHVIVRPLTHLTLWILRRSGCGDVDVGEAASAPWSSFGRLASTPKTGDSVASWLRTRWHVWPESYRVIRVFLPLF